MNATDLYFDFDGTAYNPEFDKERLTKQIGRIYECMLSGQWRTLQEISMITGAPESSVSAQLRNLRKKRFGGKIINKRRRGEPKYGLWEYQLLSGGIMFIVYIITHTICFILGMIILYCLIALQLNKIIK